MGLAILGLPEVIFYTIVGVIAFALSFIIAFAIGKSKKDHVKVDEEFINTLFDYLGGQDNIVKYSVDNSRVKFEVKDLKLANLDGLKKLSPKGVFITNNNIKTLFKYESHLIIKMLDKKMK